MASRSNTCLAGTLFTILSLHVLPALSQQGVLVNGNSQLPTCAQQCTLLIQAAQACSGTTSASTQVWSCFCQSAYLTPLKSGSGTGVCDQTCTNPTDNTQVASWYRSNCGNDFGASEHAGAGSGSTNANANANANGQNTAQQSPATTTSAANSATATPQASSGGGGTWWDSHYQWIVMVIVLAIGLIGLAVLLTWLRRRHERKQDQIRNGFNHGVTSRSAPSGLDPNVSYANNARVMESAPAHDSAQRTRESFMPYGYGYSRSDSRVGSRSSRIGDRSPIPRGGTPMTDREKEAAVGTQPSSDDEITKAPRRGILVRERSGQESTDGEKN